MKEYPLTKTELWSLGGIGIASGLFYSVATFLLANWWELRRDFAFSEHIRPETSGYWHGIMTASLWGGVTFGVLGLLFTFVGGANVVRIIHETDHDD